MGIAHSKSTVIIFHGLQGSSDENWFPWLKKILEEQGHKVIIPDLPNPENPKYNEWEETALTLILNEEKNVILIGHSLGGTLILNLLHEHLEIYNRINQAITIASPINDLGWDDLKIFFNKNRDYNSIKFNKMLLVYSKDDPHVPIPHLEKLPQHSSVLVVDNYGHFSQKEFPLIIKFIDF